MAASAASAPLLPAFSPGAVEGLLDRLGGQDAEDHRHAGRQPGLHDARGRLAGHVVVVAGLAADDAAQADHRRVLPALGQLPGHQRDLERARAPRPGRAGRRRRRAARTRRGSRARAPR